MRCTAPNCGIQIFAETRRLVLFGRRLQSPVYWEPDNHELGGTRPAEERRMSKRFGRQLSGHAPPEASEGCRAVDMAAKPWESRRDGQVRSAVRLARDRVRAAQEDAMAPRRDGPTTVPPVHPVFGARVEGVSLPVPPYRTHPPLDGIIPIAAGVQQAVNPYRGGSPCAL